MNIIVTFQSGQLTEQPKTLDDLDCFDLKMFRNCPIRIILRCEAQNSKMLKIIYSRTKE
jgi:hypothetical protein